MTAIEEYKPERAAPGQGDYKQGKEPVWGTDIVKTTSVQQQQVAVLQFNNADNSKSMPTCRN